MRGEEQIVGGEVGEGDGGEAVDEGGGGLLGGRDEEVIGYE